MKSLFCALTLMCALNAHAEISKIDQMLGITDILAEKTIHYHLTKGDDRCFKELRWDIKRSVYTNPITKQIETPGHYVLRGMGDHSEETIFSASTHTIERDNLENKRMLAKKRRAAGPERRIGGTYPLFEDLVSKKDLLKYSITHGKLKQKSMTTLYDTVSDRNLEIKKIDVESIKLSYSFEDGDRPKVEMKGCIYSKF